MKVAISTVALILLAATSAQSDSPDHMFYQQAAEGGIANAFAAEILPTVKTHLETVKKLGEAAS